MNYEKAYKEALERAKESLKDGTISSNTISYIEEIFPELKESEDEKIRKELIAHCRNTRCVTEEGAEGIAKWIAWLEKAGEQKSAKNIVESWKDMRLEVYQQASGNRHEPNYSDDTTKMFSLNDIDEIIEKMSEQKPADKVEPKFKVGDWLVHKDLVGVTCCITQIHAPHYYLTNNNSFIKFGEEDNYRPWTIQDAKDGDVLVFKNNIGGIIICKSPTNYETRSYCRLVSGNLINKEESGWDSTLLYPATKEQRDTLFKAMADAGYTFDFEKKELKNIEQKSVWSEEDEIMIKVLDSIIRYIVEIVDKDALERFGTNREELLSWLKSLKPQNRWKPNIEQLEALWCATEKYIESDNEQVRKLRGEVLESLYNDLKKLTE